MERIQETLSAIEALWVKFPEMSLGQLLANAMHASSSPSVSLFYIEDEKLRERLTLLKDHLDTMRSR